MPTVKLSAKGMGAMLQDIADPPARPRQPTMTWRFHSDWGALLDLCDERIHLTDIFDEQFQRLVEIPLKVSRLWQVLSFPGQL